jgi:hypothetical protein
MLVVVLSGQMKVLLGMRCKMPYMLMVLALSLDRVVTQPIIYELELPDGSTLRMLCQSIQNSVSAGLD